jgi:hypothetical protein
MKTIIKIVIALLVTVGCINIGRALMTEYQFEDRVHEALLFDPRMTDSEIVETVMKLANEYEIPMNPGDVHVRQSGPDVHVEMTYTTDIVVIPGVFSREWTFTPQTSTRLLVGQRRQPS